MAEPPRALAHWLHPGLYSAESRRIQESFMNRCVSFRSLSLWTLRAAISCAALFASGCASDSVDDGTSTANLDSPEIGPLDGEVPDSESDGAQFSDFYKSNYPTIDAARRKFWNQPFGCAATASTALKLGGFDVKQVLVTNEVESQLKALKWRRITNMRALRPGDVVFTSKATSNAAGTYSHVFVFHNYMNGGTNYAMVSDNYGSNHSRNLFWNGPGDKSSSVVAYRAP
jgi:hypothetical protein